MPRLLVLLSVLITLLAACAKPAVDVSDILKKVKEIDGDTSLVMTKRYGREKPFDTIIEAEYSKNGSLLKYEMRFYLNDTSSRFVMYADNDSLIYTEDVGMVGKDTFMFSKLYFRHGVCILTDEEGSVKMDPTSSFSAWQSMIDHFRTEYERAQGKVAPEDTTVFKILPYSTITPFFGYNAANTELHYNNLAKIEAVIGDHMYRILNHSGKGSSLKESDFKRQYVAVINEKGEKEAWVNCFCRNKDKDWTIEVVDSLDSEGCYFHFKLNLSDGSSYDFRSGLGE